MPEIKEKFVKIARTAVLYLSYFSLGLCVSIPGPTLIDLQHLVNTDTKHIAVIYSSRSTGFLVGSLLGGIIFDLLKNKQLPLITCCFFMSLSALATPWSPNLSTLIAAMAGGGLAMGALDTGGNVWCLNIWGKASPPFLQALHFAFGFGGLIGPLVAAPFLSQQPVDLTANSTDPRLNSSFSPTNLSSTDTIRDSSWDDLANYEAHTGYLNETGITDYDSSTSLKYIYSIIGSFSTLVTFLFMFMYCFTTKQENFSDQKKDENVRPPGRMFTCVVGVLTTAIIFIYAGIEIGYAQMLVTYAVKGNLKLSKSTGSFMTSLFWGTFTFSRGLGIFLSVKFSCLMLMIGDLVLTIISGGILLLLGTSSETFLWIGTALLGVSLASFYPSAISWVERYITVNNRVASLFGIGGALGEMVIPLLISQYIENVPHVLFYAVECSGVLCAVVMFILWLIVKRKGEKYTNGVNTCSSNEAFQEERF